MPQCLEREGPEAGPVQTEVPEVRDDVVPRIRALVETINMTPATNGRGVDIEITGRLAPSSSWQRAKPPRRSRYYRVERVKGLY